MSKAGHRYVFRPNGIRTHFYIPVETNAVTVIVIKLIFAEYGISGNGHRNIFRFYIQIGIGEITQIAQSPVFVVEMIIDSYQPVSRIMLTVVPSENSARKSFCSLIVVFTHCMNIIQCCSEIGLARWACRKQKFDLFLFAIGRTAGEVSQVGKWKSCIVE